MFVILITFLANGYIVYAQEIDTFANAGSELSVENSVSEIENILINNGTNIDAELNDQIMYYEEMLRTVEDEEQRNKIVELMSTTKELINDYRVYSNGVQTRSFHAVYSPAIAAIVSYFNFKNYHLASELLTHAKNNKDLDSIYYPVNADIVLESAVFTDIRNNNNLQGSASFPNSGSTSDKDLYYALHSFYYSKSESGRVIEIQDRYDYAGDGGYNGISGIAINVMYDAQENGYLIPFYSVIIQDFEETKTNQSGEITIDAGDKYYEEQLTLGKEEYKDYYVTFKSTGFKAIQTFGCKDTYMYLYNSKNSLIKVDDNNGYSTNAFIHYFFIANVQYKIRIKFSDVKQSGQIKLAITSAIGERKKGSNNLNTYENIYNTTSSHITLLTSSIKNHVKLYTYTPTAKGNYMIKTLGNTDTYLYLIDPRSTYLLYESSYNDNGAEGLNAAVNKELAQDVPYLIVGSNADIQSEGKKFQLEIKRI